jgi:hypothetical protein
MPRHRQQAWTELAGNAGDRALARPVGEQDVEGVVGPRGEDDVVAAHPGQRAHRLSPGVENGRSGLGCDVSANLGLVPCV